jgi:hypothetical protein
MSKRRTRDDVPEWWLDAMLLPRKQIGDLEDAETPREPGWREGPNLDDQSDYHWALEHFRGERIDPGIARVVRILKEHGVGTCQSCQGGDGHSYRHPTVDIYGEPWKALDIANNYGIRVDTISQHFSIREGNPVEYFWRVEFNARQLAVLREQWNAEEVRCRRGYLKWLADHPQETVDV